MSIASILRSLAVVLLVFAAAAPSALAQRPGRAAVQGSLAGRVLAADTGEPIASATVALWRQRDSTLATGAVTQPDGRFVIDGLRPGAYYVQFSFVGFTTRTVSDVQIGPQQPRADLGTVELEPNTAELDEVEVTGERTSVEMQIDRTVYNTADDPITRGGTATNVLETIPSVEVDVDGNVSLRGSGNVAVLINGRPAPVSADFLASYLKQLPAGSIERVEVIPNPSARYEPEGMGGIINIVLKEDADRGLGGTLTAGVDTQGGYDASGTFTYGKGPLSLAATYGFRQDEGGGGGASYRINRYADPLTILDQDELEDESETSHMLNVSGDYRLNRRTALNATAQVGLRDETEEERNEYLLLDADAAPMLNYERDVVEADDGWNTDLRLGFTHTFGEAPRSRQRGAAAHTLTGEGRYNRSVNDGAEAYTERLVAGGDLRELQEVATDRDRNETSVQLDYVRPLGEGGRFEAGYKSDFESMFSDYYSETFDLEREVFEEDANLNNTFDYDQRVHALYTQVGGQLGAVGVQVGLRGEIARTTFALETTDEAFDNNYESLFPSAFLTYEPNDLNTFKASYSRRINRPRTWFLNPFPSYDDPLNLRQGNPRVEPEYIDAFEVGYVRFTGWGSLTLTPYYRRTTNVIRRIQRLRDDGVTVRTVENLDTSDSYGVEVITALDDLGFLPGLRAYVSLEGYQVVTDGSTVEADLNSNAFGWGGRANATYRLGDRFGIGDLDLQAMFRYRAPMDTEQGRRGSFAWTDIAIKQSLMNDQASLTVRLRDPFDMAGFTYEIDQPTLFQEFERNWGIQQVGVTFSYTFGQPEQRRGRDRRGDGGGMGGDDFGGEI